MILSGPNAMLSPMQMMLSAGAEMVSVSSTTTVFVTVSKQAGVESLPIISVIRKVSAVL